MTDLPPSEGRLLDCLRRCFGLPTPPAPVSPARLQIIVWLVAALEQAEGARRPLSWSEVCRLHPLARLLAAELDRPASEVAGITDALTRIGGSAWSWEDIRLQAARRESFLDDIIHPASGRLDGRRHVCSLGAVRSPVCRRVVRRPATEAHPVGGPTDGSCRPRRRRHPTPRRDMTRADMRAGGGRMGERPYQPDHRVICQPRSRAQ